MTINAKKKLLLRAPIKQTESQPLNIIQSKSSEVEMTIPSIKHIIQMYNGKQK